MFRWDKHYCRQMLFGTLSKLSMSCSCRPSSFPKSRAGFAVAGSPHAQLFSICLDPSQLRWRHVATRWNSFEEPVLLGLSSCSVQPMEVTFVILVENPRSGRGLLRLAELFLSWSSAPGQCSPECRQLYVAYVRAWSRMTRVVGHAPAAAAPTLGIAGRRSNWTIIVTIC